MYRRMNFGPSLYLTFAEMLMQGLLVLRYEGNSDYNYLVKDQKLITGSGCLSKIHRHIDQSGAGTRYCLRPASSTTSSLPSKKKTSKLRSVICAHSHCAESGTTINRSRARGRSNVGSRHLDQIY